MYNQSKSLCLQFVTYSTMCSFFISHISLCNSLFIHKTIYKFASNDKRPLIRVLDVFSSFFLFLSKFFECVFIAASKMFKLHVKRLHRFQDNIPIPIKAIFIVILSCYKKYRFVSVFQQQDFYVRTMIPLKQQLSHFTPQ